MIYEIRTYNLKPGAVPDYLKRFSDGYKVREKYSPMLGMWTTEIGPLNQVIHMWGYDNLQHRADTRSAAMKDASGNWPPATNDLLVSQESDILTPIKGSPEVKGSQEWGGIYELRMYTYQAGDLRAVAEKFSEKVGGRAALYPVAGIFTSELGNLNRLYQLFPYKNWAHRDELRGEYLKSGVWPPHSDAHPLQQLVRHLIPAPFSPLH
ncbi:MAG: hypothetical protein EXR52_07940 [Dehalococcoidia bacterium]|nr:hypothetical protein [Dehalococcoidia bacterium]